MAYFALCHSTMVVLDVDPRVNPVTAAPDDDITVLLTWGDGSHGALGHGQQSCEFLPRIVHSLVPRRLRSVFCGGSATFVIAVNGEVYSCGSADHGLLGQGDGKGIVSVPRQVRRLRGQGVLSVACGDRHAAAVGAGGELFTWGSGSDGQLGSVSSAGAVVSTPHASVDLASGAQATAAARLADQMSETVSGPPLAVSPALPCGIKRLFLSSQEMELAIEAAAAASAIACGAFHTLALARSGALYSWGLAGAPQLGQVLAFTRDFPDQSCMVYGSLKRGRERVV